MLDWSSSASGGTAVAVNTVSKAALLEDIDARLRETRGFTVATLNLDHAVKLRSDPEFRAAYAGHSHVVADGNPVVWLERLSGRDVQLTPGSELVEPVAELAARHGIPVALVGSTEESLQRAGDALCKRYPGLEIADRIAPAMGFEPTSVIADDVVKRLSESGAGLAFLALGAPRQEIFATYAAKQLPNVGFLSIGAGLDFLAGSQVRAPSWVRALAAEWIWRLGSNPRRLAKRYGACIAILPSLTQAALSARRKGNANA